MCVILLKIKRFALLGGFIYSFEYLRYNKCLLGLGADLGVIDNGVDEGAGFKLGGVAGRTLKECGSAGFKVRGLDALAVSYTHLTLPTILRV